MVTPSLARRIPDKRFGVGNAKLDRQHSNGADWRFPRIVEESTKEPDSTELQRKAQTHVVATAPIDQVAVGVIQMEKPRELLRRRLPDIAPISAHLLLGQKTDRHRGLAELLSFATPWDGETTCDFDRYLART